jgi:hypothetical protein
MLVLMGARVRYRVVGRGVFHCERCGGDRPYQQRSGRRWFHVLGIPVARLGPTGEHLRCAICRTCYRVELLAVPTTEQMQEALLTATTAAVLAMLDAGDAGSASRRRGVEAIRLAGSPQFDDASLRAALAGEDLGLGPAVEAVAIQLETCAKEWFLARVVAVGLEQGSLGGTERDTAQQIAQHLGLTQSRARHVIARAEEAAQAG